jgi:MFS family permease
MAVPESEAVITNYSLLTNISDHLKEMTQVFGKDARKQTALACFMMGMQQLSGIDGVLYYAPLLFQQAGLASEQASFLASGVSALVMLVVTIPASIYVDHWGRRASTILGGILLASCMLLIGGLYASQAVHGDRGAARWAVIVTIFLFGVVFCMTWAIGIRIYSSEIQPSRTRAGATSLAQSTNWVSDIAFIPFCTTLTCATGNQLAGSIHNPNPPLRILFGSVFSVRRVQHLNSSNLLFLHARNKREESGSN